MTNSSLFTRKVYETKQEKRRDFIIGAVLWVVMNACLAGVGYGAIALSSAALYGGDPSTIDYETAGTITNMLVLAANCLPLLLNVGLMVYFGFTRAWIALGMLGAFGAALLVSICLSVLFVTFCFITLSQY